MKKQCLASILMGCLCPFHVARSQYGYAVLDTNDVSAMFHSAGLVGLMPGLSEPNFFVPKSLGPNGPSPLFSSTLWVGGVDAGGILHLAAERFQQLGHDYYPGPLGSDGSISSSTSLMYDQLWKVDRADVERQVLYFNCLSDPDCDEQAEYPGYATPTAFYQWPAHGDVSLGQGYYLAPFHDVDGDGIYDPDNGDVPCVPGDQALFAIFNDNLTVHSESGGQPIGMEVHMTAFSYVQISPALDQTVFIHYKLINRGNLQLNNA